MSIASELTKLRTNLSNAYTACQNKSATMPESQTMANLSSTIMTIQSGSGGAADMYGVDISSVVPEYDSGMTQPPKTSKLVYPAESVPSYGLYMAAGAKGTGVTIMATSKHLAWNLSSIEFPNLTSVGSYGLAYFCTYNDSLKKASFSKLEKADATYAFQSLFRYCTNLEEVEFPSLTSITAVSQQWSYAFYNCQSLKYMDLSHLSSGTLTSNQMSYMFNGCSSMTDLSVGLNKIGNTQQTNFAVGCTSLSNICLNNAFTMGTYLTAMFPTTLPVKKFTCKMLASSGGWSSFVKLSAYANNVEWHIYDGGYPYYFYSSEMTTASRHAPFKSGDEVYFYLSDLLNATYMAEKAQYIFYGCSGFTLHLPSNTQSRIEGGTYYATNFGGSDITYVYDLPAIS